ncbi:PREDICTED: ARM REPEAT PROTEIN INTERACTING WITH ABF2-like, partial [Erythranthe guttata]|uniref:ARM REPEAT PROTEIN INTERACTING WITH ABF2-like n=1 Tax=Erythranthe guttata TaxID=4155 RepID=UPI00064DD9FE
MENQNQNSGRRHREQSATSSRRSLKRKLDEDSGEDRGRIGGESPSDSQQDLVTEIRTQVEILDSVASSAAEQDRASVKRAIHVLSELAKNEDIVNAIVDCAAVPVLVKHLKAPPLVTEIESGPRLYEHEVRKEVPSLWTL